MDKLEKELITMTEGSIGVESVENLINMHDLQGGNDTIILSKQIPVDDDDHMGDNESRIRQYSSDNKGPFVVCIRVRDRDKQPLESVRLTKFIRNANKSKIDIRQVNEFKMRVTFIAKVEGVESTSTAPTQLLPTQDMIDLARYEANSLPKAEEFNKKYRIYIPEKLVESIGCATFSTSDDIKELKTSGFGKFKNPNMPKVKILEVLRFKKVIDATIVGAQPTTTDTSTIRVTFEGLLIPEYIELFGLLIPVREFKRRQMFCKLCLRYNHTESHCVNKPSQDANVTTAQQCVQCKSVDHKAGDKNCPRRKQLEKKDRAHTKLVQRKSYAEMLQQLDPSNVMPGETAEEFPRLDTGTRRKRLQNRSEIIETPRDSPVKKRVRDTTVINKTPIGFRNPNLNDESDEIDENDENDDDIAKFLKGFIRDLHLPTAITNLIIKFVLPIVNKFVSKITNSFMKKISQFGQ